MPLPTPAVNATKAIHVPLRRPARHQLALGRRGGGERIGIAHGKQQSRHDRQCRDEQKPELGRDAYADIIQKRREQKGDTAGGERIAQRDGAVDAPCLQAQHGRAHAREQCGDREKQAAAHDRGIAEQNGEQRCHARTGHHERPSLEKAGDLPPHRRRREHAAGDSRS